MCCCLPQPLDAVNYNCCHVVFHIIAGTKERFEGQTHPQHPQNYTRLLGGLLPIHLTHWRGAQGLMWGARGPFLLAAAMVGYGCVCCYWPLEANLRSTYCRNRKNFLRKYFFYSYKPVGAAPRKQCFTTEAVPYHRVFCIIIISLYLGICCW